MYYNGLKAVSRQRDPLSSLDSLRFSLYIVSSSLSEARLTYPI